MHDISIRVRYVGRGAGCIVWPRIESPENRSRRLFERTIDEYFVSRRAIENTKLVEASRRVQFMAFSSLFAGILLASRHSNIDYSTNWFTISTEILLNL